MKKIEVNGETYILQKDISTPLPEETLRIVIAQRGWVVIGRYSEKDGEAIVRDAKTIRRWGTENGLGQLALEGKQEDTVLDEVGEWRSKVDANIATIIVDESKWVSIF